MHLLSGSGFNWKNREQGMLCHLKASVFIGGGNRSDHSREEMTSEDS